MSKSALKKELLKLTKEQLVEQILDLYEKNKSIKEFYDFYLNPHNEKELVEKYKKIIRKEFNVERPERGSEKFSVAKKAISDLLPRLKSENGHVVIRVEKGGKQYRVLVLDDESESFVIKSMFGPYVAN